MENFAVYAFPFGFLKIGYREELVLFLETLKHSDHPGQKTAFTEKVFREITEYLEGKRKSFTFAYELRGTEFQKRVWRALTEIPYGETRSYKEIAIAIGNEKAARAVGLANNKNPVAIVVPCHRVIGSNGKLVGYAGGLPMKQALLQLEQAHNRENTLS